MILNCYISKNMAGRPNTSNPTSSIEGMVNVMQQQHAAQVPQNHDCLSDFMMHNPSKFNGEATPDEADAWIRKIEKIFKAIACPEKQKLVYASFLLVDGADYWWDGMQQIMEDRCEAINWASFRTRFLERYFPDSYKFQREAEFLVLQQGKMTVQTYVDRFEYLARFVSQKMSEEYRCRRFQGGLRPELRIVIVPLKIKEFPTLVDKTKMIEQLQVDLSLDVRTQKGSFSGEKQQRKPYDKPQQFSCGKTDGKSCFICNKLGHFARACSERKLVSGPQQQKSSGGKPTAARRVLVMSDVKVAQSGNLILETCYLYGRCV